MKSFWYGFFCEKAVRNLLAKWSGSIGCTIRSMTYNILLGCMKISVKLDPCVLNTSNNRKNISIAHKSNRLKMRFQFTRKMGSHIFWRSVRDVCLTRVKINMGIGSFANVKGMHRTFFTPFTCHLYLLLFLIKKRYKWHANGVNVMVLTPLFLKVAKAVN